MKLLLLSSLDDKYLCSSYMLLSCDHVLDYGIGVDRTLESYMNK
jgi:hypothetical protein